MWKEINFVLRKNGGHMPSSLGGRLIVEVRQTGRQTKYLQFTKFLKFNNLILKHI